MDGVRVLDVLESWDGWRARRWRSSMIVGCKAPEISRIGLTRYPVCPFWPPSAPQTSSQETLRLIRTKKVEYPAWLSPDSISFMTRWAVGRISSTF